MERLGPTRRCRLLQRDGQHLVEYAIIIGVAAAAAIGMQTYVKRAIQAQLKGQVDYWFNVARDGLPQECVEKGITDPAECTQEVGMVLQDVEKLEQEAGGPTNLSQAERIGQQQLATSYIPSGGPVTTVTLRNDGTSFRVTGTAHSLAKNSLPPDFARRPQLPNGVPTGNPIGIRSPTPSVREVAGSASAQRAAELGQEQQRKKKGVTQDDEEGGTE